ncbi:MAG TPA: hypothetical protein VF698_06295 [Thermoanaerobaculia bacterium]
MRKTLVAVTILAAATTASAQYIPPARDTAEATRLFVEIGRALAPVIEQAKEHAAVAALIGKVQRQLGDDNTAALTAATDAIDEYLRLRERGDAPTSRDMLRHIQAVRAKIEQQKLLPPVNDLKPLREEIHHEHVHALQKTLIADANAYQQMADSLDQLKRLLQATSRNAMTAAELGTAEVKR